MKKTDNKPAYGQKKRVAATERGTASGAAQSAGPGPIGTSVDWEIPGDVPEKARRSIYPYAPRVNSGAKRIIGGTPARSGSTEGVAGKRSSSSAKAQTGKRLNRRSLLSIPGLIVLALILGLGGFGYMHLNGDNDLPGDASVGHVGMSANAPLEDVPSVMQAVLHDVSEQQVTSADQRGQPELADKTGEVTRAVPQPRIITHVVKKGDTLWDIAEYYVNDPFRYPELAELSEIENPDLIYPGEIVRIRVR